MAKMGIMTPSPLYFKNYSVLYIWAVSSHHLNC